MLYVPVVPAGQLARLILPVTRATLLRWLYSVSVVASHSGALGASGAFLSFACTRTVVWSCSQFCLTREPPAAPWHIAASPTLPWVAVSLTLLLLKVVCAKTGVADRSRVDNATRAVTWIRLMFSASDGESGLGHVELSTRRQAYHRPCAGATELGACRGVMSRRCANGRRRRARAPRSVLRHTAWTWRRIP